MADDKPVSTLPTPGSTPLTKPGQSVPVYGSPALTATRRRNQIALGLAPDKEAPVAKPATPPRSMSKR
jgi:hypothetical protein